MTHEELRDILDALYIAKADLPYTFPEWMDLPDRLQILIERFRKELEEKNGRTEAD
jgi:hypothetical protein